MLLTVATNCLIFLYSCHNRQTDSCVWILPLCWCENGKLRSLHFYFFGPRAFPEVRSSSEEVRRQIILLVLSLSVTLLCGFRKCMTPASAEVQHTRIFITYIYKRKKKYISCYLSQKANSKQLEVWAKVKSKSRERLTPLFKERNNHNKHPASHRK